MNRSYSLALLALVSVMCLAPLAAEEQNYFPRTRMTQDLILKAGDSRYRDPRGLLGQGAFSAGARAGYISDYYWRGFKLYDQDLLLHGDAYLNIYGFEISAWGIWDANREKNRPLEADYRFNYFFELEGSLIGLGYTFFDFAGSDGDIGRKTQGFGDKPLRDFPDDKFPASIHEAHIMFSTFAGLLQEGGANLRYTLNLHQRLDDEGTRVDNVISLFVDGPSFTVFGDYFEIGTTTTYQHRYLTNDAYFQGQTVHGRAVYNLHKYGIAPLFIQIDAWYYVAFHKELVDGFYFGATLNLRF